MTFAGSFKIEISQVLSLINGSIKRAPREMAATQRSTSYFYSNRLKKTANISSVY